MLTKRPSKFWDQQQRLYEADGNNWQVTSQTVRRMANNRCVQCGCGPSKGNGLHAHHKVSITPMNSSFANSLDNLEVLCKSCHSTRHGHMIKKLNKNKLL